MGRLFIRRAYYPGSGEWEALCSRPETSYEDVRMSVDRIMDTVRSQGDSALFTYEKEFDKAYLQTLEISMEERDRFIVETGILMSDDLKEALSVAARNIRTFHEAQMPFPQRVETMPGVTCWRKSVPLEKVGIYIPGGTAPLFSTVLMLAVPASIAGCKEIILCTPPSPNGTVHPAILYAARLAGVTRIFTVGGAQAIAAMAYGTESVPRCHKVLGPGNTYVTYAKQRASMDGTAIDMPAGPSEVMVLADGTARPDFVAVDLLSQAEHGSDSQAILVLVEPDTVKADAFLDYVDTWLERMAGESGRLGYISSSLGHSRAIVVKKMAEAVGIANLYAAEHLIIQTEMPVDYEKEITNAGSIFLGSWSPESAGDYASGTNHTLPTGGWAHSYSGVSLDTFYKKITVQELSREGLERLAPTIVAMAEGEGLQAHAQAVRTRMNLLRETIPQGGKT
ncbi:histidinol dehydrogenase [Parasphaerochaeta coccoides]|uniref:Histidinol dehydrogenase n=1 Tax=Parasphaerochaeta coccoides (strain ATCC BAA-1237 / DSM 17374 / SPN1) TaxID=760011 RepID=F4GI32_PARC1|nr:histidinol dehydrogenase [Parasphaerochaeta coccoides]AEC02630.1 histidinol dehydrogenase [Parasphaerochaeta coccoides DSM 17374]